jgi:hypothetical protein
MGRAARLRILLEQDHAAAQARRLGRGRETGASAADDDHISFAELLLRHALPLVCNATRISDRPLNGIPVRAFCSEENRRCLN